VQQGRHPLKGRQAKRDGDRRSADPLEGKRSAQALKSRRRQVIKAEWPRFGTKRGAQPASPTAVRRDARMFSVYVELRGKLDELE
jgi:hypothetical protein